VLVGLFLGHEVRQYESSAGVSGSEVLVAVYSGATSWQVGFRSLEDAKAAFGGKLPERDQLVTIPVSASAYIGKTPAVVRFRVR
jgi:hypothetical protein